MLNVGTMFADGGIGLVYGYKNSIQNGRFAKFSGLCIKRFKR